jgi:hypothetical protein
MESAANDGRGVDDATERRTFDDEADDDFVLRRDVDDPDGLVRDVFVGVVERVVDDRDVDGDERRATEGDRESERLGADEDGDECRDVDRGTPDRRPDNVAWDAICRRSETRAAAAESKPPLTGARRTRSPGRVPDGDDSSASRATRSAREGRSDRGGVVEPSFVKPESAQRCTRDTER